MARRRCFLAQFSTVPCSGALRKVHLIEKQAMRRRGHRDLWDPRSWVWACGGSMGLGGHHGLFDRYELVVPAWAVPDGVVDLARELRMTSYLERRYGLVVS